MEHEELLSVIEAILFAAGDPVPASRIALVTGEETQTIVSAARELAAAYEENRCGMRLVQMNDLLQLCSAPEYAEYIRRALEQRKPPKLSQPALEVLAIVAYFQPVTRAYIDQVRGVDSAYKTAGPPKKKSPQTEEGKAEKRSPCRISWTILALAKLGLRALDRSGGGCVCSCCGWCLSPARRIRNDTASAPGYVNAALGALTPLAERALRIDERDIQTGVDFQAERPRIDARIVCTDPYPDRSSSSRWRSAQDS